MKRSDILWELKEKSHAIIEGLGEKIPKDFQLRLGELGLLKSGSITCLKKTPFNGPTLYQVGDSVISLAQEVAENIYISRKTNG
ncbi:MAG: ferrous iron transport protein A [Epsilonproteobacteria bacterium]|nr:MAG: ferrous iron transport protein A [Campylobacterota bacterium]RLA66062.1 MAG: ferrous iron transport protein A [Campylobacterota bacterium]